MTRNEQWLLEEKHGGEKTSAYETDVKRLARGEPLAYVIGYQPFLGLKIFLDSRPLIPRPETEWWTEELLNTLVKNESAEGRRSTTKKVWPATHSEDRRPDDFLRSAAPLLFLDLCAGSGAIGCAALAALPRAQIYFGEIDPTHASTITKNIQENHLDASRAHIGIGDLFEPFKDTRFDVIAANPPYIPADRALDTSVTSYEQPRALFAGNDGLSLIRRIARELATHLAPDGVAWVEVDSEHAATACSLFTVQGFTARVISDQYERPRILVVS